MKDHDQQNRVPLRYVSLYRDLILECNLQPRTYLYALSRNRDLHSKHHPRRLSVPTPKLVALMSRKSHHRHMSALQDGGDPPDQSLSQNPKSICSAQHPSSLLHNPPLPGPRLRRDQSQPRLPLQYPKPHDQKHLHETFPPSLPLRFQHPATIAAQVRKPSREEISMLHTIHTLLRLLPYLPLIP